MNEQTARRVSWSIAVVSTVVAIVGLVFSILALTADGHTPTFSHQFFIPLLTLTYCVIGALVASRHPRNPIGWMFCATGFLSSLNMLSAGYALYDQLAVTSGSLPGATIAHWLTFWIWIPNILLPVTLPLLLFPDGRFLSPRWRLVAWAAGLSTVALSFAVAFHPGPAQALGSTWEVNPFGMASIEGIIDVLVILVAPFFLVGVFGSIAAVVVRFRRASGVERAQLKWLAYAAVLFVVGNILGGIPWVIAPDSLMAVEFSIVVTSITVVNIVIAIGIAILRYRLWDIDIIINRTLVYGSLTAIIIAVYVVVVGSLGALFESGSGLVVSLFATGIVATSFQPIRERVQRVVNRLMYGERDEPYAVLGRLSERLEVVVAAQAVLPTIVETVAEALRLPYAAISLKSGESFAIAAEYPRAAANRRFSSAVEILPLVYQSEAIGQLTLALRAPGEQFSHADRRLLETIARQAGIATHNVRLTQDLRRSRERLVTAREEERRRLRRDLHDGLGPELAAMSFKLDAIHNLADHDASAIRTLVGELKAQMQEALSDIRRIAYNLRPPALDELGLVGALNEHITAHNQSGRLQISITVPDAIPPLSAAVEVAVYRIVLEAITNVVRHADARRCEVRLVLDDHLCIEITDDGRGIPEGVRAGVGMTSMRERAEELGGTCAIEAAAGGGTRVLVRLPLEDSASVGEA